jgi:hypothetical protein
MGGERIPHLMHSLIFWLLNRQKDYKDHQLVSVLVLHCINDYITPNCSNDPVVSW